MITPALDSSGKAAGVALLREEELIYEAYLNNGLTHSETLLPMVQRAFETTGTALSEIGLLAVGAGPGSFTGLRIGLALAKGLALPDAIPCAGVSSLEALARSIPLMDGAAVIAAADARRGEVYYAAFRRQGTSLVRLCPDTAGRPDPLAALLAGEEKTVFVVGDGAQVCYNRLKEAIPLEPVPDCWQLGRAAGVAFAGRALWLAGCAVPAAQLRPDYHRLSQAQRERMEKMKESENQ